MAREARLFNSSEDSPVSGFLKLRANVTPRWIDNARTSRKRFEADIDKCLRKVKHLRKSRPRAKAAIKQASKELRAVLRQWNTLTQKRSSIVGVRVLLEIQRNGSSSR